jgi:hypothetical protein
MLVYNIKRAINILGMEDLMEKLKNWTPNYDKIVWLLTKWVYLKPNTAPKYYTKTLAA